MSWHWVGPAFESGAWASCALMAPATIPGRAWCSAALSAAVGAPVPFRALTMLSSNSATHIGWITSSLPWKVPTYPLFALASANSLTAATLSSGASPCLGGFTRLLKIRGELTIAACSGCAIGTLMTSIRNSAELGSFGAPMQPGSSLGDRTGAEPEMYTYTFCVSLGSTRTEWVWEPRQV